jgi:hypothetical protein
VGRSRRKSGKIPSAQSGGTRRTTSVAPSGASRKRRRHRSVGAWYRSLTKGVQAFVAIVVGAGAVALAIGAILALRPTPTPELRGTITKLAIDPHVTLGDYRARNENAAYTAPAPRQRSLAAVLPPRPAHSMPLAAALGTTEATTTSTTQLTATRDSSHSAPDQVTSIQPKSTLGTNIEGTTTEGTTTEGTTTEGTTTEGTTTEGTTTEGTTTEGTTTEGTTTGSNGTRHPSLMPTLDATARQALTRGVRRALDSPPVLELQMGVGLVCLRDPSDPDCGLRTAEAYLQVVNEDGSVAKVDPRTVERRLAELLRATRTEPLADSAGKVEPIGVAVDYDVSLTGFRGKRVTVKWSLYRADGATQVPHEWLRNQAVHWLKGEAESDSASAGFWAPLPRTQGAFFIRIGLYDDDGIRLDFRDTEQFR